MKAVAEVVGALCRQCDRDCCYGGILLNRDICGCLIAFLKGSHFIFDANRGRVFSGEDIQLNFLAESTGHEAP